MFDNETSIFSHRARGRVRWEREGGWGGLGTPLRMEGVGGSDSPPPPCLWNEAQEMAMTESPKSKSRSSFGHPEKNESERLVTVLNICDVWILMNPNFFVKLLNKIRGKKGSTCLFLKLGRMKKKEIWMVKKLKMILNFRGGETKKKQKKEIIRSPWKQEKIEIQLWSPARYFTVVR